MKKIIPIYALLTAFALLMSVSCNDNGNGNGDEPTVISSNTLVSAFSLAENDSVLASLDSLHFTIDVDNRLIYNADSLPKGTKINRLVANISLYDYNSTGTIRISGAQTMEDTTYTYNSSANDSIDFTGNVSLTVNAADGSTREYRILVNVHQMEADSLYWNQLARRNLPARSSELVSQKTVQKNEELFCLVEEERGFTISPQRMTRQPTTGTLHRLNSDSPLSSTASQRPTKRCTYSPTMAAFISRQTERYGQTPEQTVIPSLAAMPTDCFA